MSSGVDSPNAGRTSDLDPPETTPGTVEPRTAQSTTGPAVAQPTDVVDAFFNQCTSHTAEGAWKNFGQLGLIPPKDSARTVEVLLQFFPADLIEKSKVGVREPDGAFRPNSLLSDAQFFIPLKSRTSNTCFDVITPSGCLAGRTAAEAAADAWPVAALDANNDPFAGYLFLTATLGDAAVLRSLRMAAAPAAELCTLSDQPLARFLKRFGLEPDDPSLVEDDPTFEDGEPDVPASVEAAVRPPALILVGWSPLTLKASLPPQIKQLRRSFIELSRDGAGCFDGVYFWRGTTEMLKKVREGRERGDKGAIRNALGFDLVGSTNPLLKTPHDLTKIYDKPASHVDARDQLDQVRHFQGDPAVEKRAQQNCRETFKETFDQKLRKRAENSPDPVTATLINALGDTAQLHHELALRMLPRPPKQNPFRTHVEPLPDDYGVDHKKFRELTADLLKLCQEIRERETRKPLLRRTPLQYPGGGSKKQAAGRTAPPKHKSGGSQADANTSSGSDSTAAAPSVRKAK